MAFLASLPSFAIESDDIGIASISRHLERCIRDLCQEGINSAAALETIPYLADAAFYPLVVVAHAAMLAHGFPPTFFLDGVHTLLGSILSKDLYVQLGSYKSKSRHWFCGVADAGQGKSPTIKPLVKLLLSTLQAHSALAPPGRVSEQFHLCQSSTTAAAIAKLRSAAGYLLLHSDDAGRCVSLAFASGG